MIKFQNKLQQLKDKNRFRALSRPCGIDLSSNDYLGMAHHPQLRRYAAAAIESGMPLGAGAARLLRGNHAEHDELEAYAAQHFGHEAALYFSTGFQAGQSIFQGLTDRHDGIIYDSLIHACMRTGIQNSPAKSYKAEHNDLDSYRDLLRRARQDCKGMLWIAAESVYSMDGDLAPLGELVALAEEFGAMLVIDEAHGSGVFGETGRGLSESLTKTDNLIVMHTCGKAYGVSGGLVCASREIIDILINNAHGFIFSTAPAPLMAHLTLKSIQILEKEPEKRKKLHENIKLLGEYLEISNHYSQIIPIIIGEDAKAVTMAQKLQEFGYDVRAVRPPTVPEGTARLRISLNSELDPETLKSFAETLKSLL